MIGNVLGISSSVFHFFLFFMLYPQLPALVLDMKPFTFSATPAPLLVEKNHLSSNRCRCHFSVSLGKFIGAQQSFHSVLHRSLFHPFTPTIVAAFSDLPTSLYPVLPTPTSLSKWPISQKRTQRQLCINSLLPSPPSSHPSVAMPILHSFPHLRAEAHLLAKIHLFRWLSKPHLPKAGLCQVSPILKKKKKMWFLDCAFP